jgi:hypothetical protein
VGTRRGALADAWSPERLLSHALVAKFIDCAGRAARLLDAAARLAEQLLAIDEVADVGGPRAGVVRPRSKSVIAQPNPGKAPHLPFGRCWPRGVPTILGQAIARTAVRVELAAGSGTMAVFC